MSQKIYVGNLPPNATGGEIRKLFSEYGSVEWVNLVTDTATGKSRGFGYVKMASGTSAAIQALDSWRLRGRRLDVRRALPLAHREVADSRMPRRARNYWRAKAATWSFSEPRRVGPAPARPL